VKNAFDSVDSHFSVSLSVSSISFQKRKEREREKRVVLSEWYTGKKVVGLLRF